MLNYKKLTSDDELHITTGNYTTILEIAKIIQLFSGIGRDVIRKHKRRTKYKKMQSNEANPYIKQFWTPKTSIKEDGKKCI